MILGGHSHELIKDVKEGENLLYGKDGNPVVITQAGKDADNIGLINLEFDENGVITKVQNNVIESKHFNLNLLCIIHKKIKKKLIHHKKATNRNWLLFIK